MMDNETLKLQLDLCMGCGYCRDAYGDEGWLETLKTKHVCPTREIMGFDAYTAKGRILVGKAIIENHLPLSASTTDVYFFCTLCGNCEAHCISRGLPFVPPDLKIREIIRYFRKRTIEENMPIPTPLTRIKENVLNEGNVFGEKEKDEDTPYLSKNKESKVIYFRGCMATYRERQITRAFDNLARKLALDVGCLDSENCCGNVFFRTGQVETGMKLMERNINKFKKADIKTLITSCPGCLNAFNNEYRFEESGLELDIQHVSEYLASLPDLGRKLKNEVPKKVTYHDPCELGRISMIYDTPRMLLEKIPLMQLVEPFRTKVNSWCCGAGGGVQAAYPDESKKIAKNRYDELKNTGADFIVTACPNCTHAIGQAGKIFDLAELLETFLEE
ncbi:MAG: (Fe-S)-binding protein [Candidatus Hodarchaeota archaeon]